MRGPIHYRPIAVVAVTSAWSRVLGAWFFRVKRRDFMDLV